MHTRVVTNNLERNLTRKYLTFYKIPEILC
jgi:hypothetical protein